MSDEMVVNLEIPSDPGCLCLSRDLVQRSAKLSGLGERDARLVMLAVDEACSNIIRHSYRGDVRQRIIVTCQWVKAKSFEVRLKDFGRGSDSSFLTQDRQARPLSPGGLGVNIMRQVMDEIHYDPNCGDGVELRMVKRVRPAEED